MKTKLTICAALVTSMSLFLWVVTMAQQSYTPTDDQSIALQLKAIEVQKTRVLWQQAANRLPEKATYDKALVEYRAEGETVKVQNKWPEDVKFNEASGVYYDSKPPK